MHKTPTQHENTLVKTETATPERVFNEGRRSGEGEVSTAVLAQRH